MNILDNINEETIIICNNSNKERILLSSSLYNKLFNIKILSLDELRKIFYFSYSNESIYYLMHKYNYKYDIAKMYLDNIIYVDNKKYNNDKLDKLVSIKNDLDNKGLLIYDEKYKNYLQNKNIIVYNYDYINNFDKRILEIFGSKIITKTYNNNIHSIYEFNTIDEEISFVASSICKLIHNKVDINKIKLCNVTEEYNDVISRIFGLYNIPVVLDDNAYLSSTIVGKYIIENFSSNLEEVIKEAYNLFDNDIVSQIVDIINQYTFEDDKLLVKDMILEELYNTKVRVKTLTNYVEIKDISDIEKDEYAFLIGFNEGSIPLVLKDEVYLCEKEHKILGLETVNELNKINKEITIKNIKTINNLNITYKLKDNTKIYYPSNIINDLKYKVIKEKENFNYSNKYNKILLCKMYDKYYKYGIKDENLHLLASNYNINYKTYNNQFNGISKETFKKLTNNEITLSYSSMNTYNECGFKYYINYILKIDDFVEHFSTYIGNLFHYILQIGLEKEINVQEKVQEYVSNNKPLTSKEAFYITKLIPDIKFALDEIKMKSRYSKFKEFELENEFCIVKNNNIKVKFKGYIDKLMTYDENDIKYAAIVDYKTYNIDISLDLIDYGLNMQLPIYLYLTNYKYKNIVFAGFYFQPVLSEDNKYIYNKSLIERKKESLKLVGYSNSNTNILSLFDSTYMKSEMIKSLSYNNNFGAYSKVLSSDEIKKLVIKAEEKIDESIKNISDCNFIINPKEYKNINKSCKYCKYKDLCYMTNDDVITIKGKDD